MSTGYLETSFQVVDSWWFLVWHQTQQTFHPLLKSTPSSSKCTTLYTFYSILLLTTQMITFYSNGFTLTIKQNIAISLWCSNARFFNVVVFCINIFPCFMKKLLVIFVLRHRTTTSDHRCRELQYNILIITYHPESLHKIERLTLYKFY